MNKFLNLKIAYILKDIGLSIKLFIILIINKLKLLSQYPIKLDKNKKSPEAVMSKSGIHL